jgi:hypothetical protein
MGQSGKINLFIRERITGLDTPEVVYETEREFTIADYDKRQLYITGSRRTTLFELGTINAGTLNGNALDYGRITNQGSANICLTITGTGTEANFQIAPGKTFYINNDRYSPISGSYTPIQKVECENEDDSGKHKVEYLICSKTAVAG